ncbi:MAG: type IV pilin N-terminal domain-containing protein [Methanofollis sp.]|nr:type IV pilin N-terminal domain-containing protein [Methanofollis sp.]
MRTLREDHSAVSPIVGVMLMLVVTVIIAAVVSAYAAGMGEQNPKAPQANLEMTVITTPGWQGLQFEHKGGDVIDLKDLKIGFMTGDTQMEMGYYDKLSEKYRSLDQSVKDGTYHFQKVGAPPAGGWSGPDTYIRPGESFMVYADQPKTPFGFMGFKGEKSSCALYWEKKNTYTLFDKQTGAVYSTGKIIPPVNKA